MSPWILPDALVAGHPAWQAKQLPWQPHPPTLQFFVSPFPLSTKVFQGQASTTLRTGCPLPQEVRQGRWEWRCVCHSWINFHQYKCICTYFWVRMCALCCISMHVLCKWSLFICPLAILLPSPLCCPCTSPSPSTRVLSHGSSWVSVFYSLSPFFPQSLLTPAGLSLELWALFTTPFLSLDSFSQVICHFTSWQ